MSAERTPLLARLRSETRSEHDAIEAVFPLARAELDERGVANALRRMLGFYEPVEEALGRVGWNELGIDFEARRKTGLLWSDLASVGDHDAFVERCTRLPAVDTPARALGCLYVLEGATLGGRVLAEARRIAGAVPLRSFEPYAERVGAMWRAFGESLTSFAATRPDEADAVVESARATFESYRRWLAAA